MSPSLACPIPPVPGDLQKRKTRLGEIAHSFERFAGFQINDGVLKKLVQQFADVPDDQMDTLVYRMKGLPFHHPEWQTLLDILTVHETYFYRDGPQLEQVREALIPRLIDHAIKKMSFRLRLWSAGCSTGEEVYMLAFLVLEELVRRGQASWSPQGEMQVDPAWNIEILGSDLSSKVLDQARSGRYRCNHHMSSFRELPPGFRLFFSFPLSSQIGYESAGLAPVEFAQVKPSVRRLTRFTQQNLAEGLFSGEEFDLVFCRNVLIYFQDEVKLKVQEMLHRSLRKGGGLVLGPPDVLMLPKLFHRRSGSLSVYYEKC